MAWGELSGSVLSPNEIFRCEHLAILERDVFDEVQTPFSGSSG